MKYIDKNKQEKVIWMRLSVPTRPTQRISGLVLLGLVGIYLVRSGWVLFSLLRSVLSSLVESDFFGYAFQNLYMMHGSVQVNLDQVGYRSNLSNDQAFVVFFVIQTQFIRLGLIQSLLDLVGLVQQVLALTSNHRCNSCIL